MTDPKFKAGDVIWKECRLENGLGDSLDILGLISEINIYEDIYSPTLTGVALVVDTHNLLSRFPILGEEKLHVQFQTPEAIGAGETGENLEIKQTFRVYKAENRAVEMNKEIYNLFFFSEEAAQSHTTRWSLPFSGNGDAIVNKVIKEKLGSNKSIITTPTGNYLKFVSPYWTPFACIDYVCRHTVAPTPFREADYVFFENNRGYRFISLNNMKQISSKFTYFYDHSRSFPIGNTVQESTLDLSRQMSSIINTRFLSMGNWAQRVDQNAYTNLVLTHDLTYKTVNYQKYDIDSNYTRLNHLGGVINADRPDESVDHYPHYFEPKNSPPGKAEEYNTNIAYTAHRSYNELETDYSGLVELTRAPLLAQNEFLKFDIDVWGNTQLAAGDTLWINFGKLTSPQTDAEYNANELYDPVLTGKYMITAIAHRVGINQHQMTMQVVKESVGVELQSYAREQYKILQMKTKGYTRT
jgi:hypothetical protein